MATPLEANFQHPARMHLSWAERRIWLAAIGLWFVGDLAITTLGLWLGFSEGNLNVLVVALVLGIDVLSVLAVGKLLALVVSGLLFALLTHRVRVVIPLTYVGVGAWIVSWNLWVMWTGLV